MPDPYLSELKYLGSPSVDFIEVAVDTGTDVSGIQVVVYHPNGTIRSTDSLGPVVNTIAGRDVYVVDTATAADFNGVHKNGAVALVQDGVVLQFLSFESTVSPTTGPAAGMTSTPLGATGQGESLETTDDGASYQVQTTPNSGTVPCFLSGTLIETDRGARRVEDLRAGDRVATLDHGFQPLLWAGSRALPLSALADPDMQPICVPRGALAPGVPHRDLYLSANHRVMLDHALCDVLFHAPEVLASAKSLTGHRGIGTRPVGLPIHFHHLLFARHEVILANGLPSESFHPGPVGINAFGAAEQAQLRTLLPDIDRDNAASYGPTARLALRPDEAQLLITLARTDDLVAPARELAPRAA